MFETVALTAVAIGLLAMSGLMVIGGLKIRNGSRQPAPTGAGTTWPAVSLIVPVVGTSAIQDDSLLSLLKQDYADYEIVFITESAGEPAADTIRRCRGERAGLRVRHVTAGPATTCSQKNTSLLAGIAAATPTTTILVFCDAGHIMPAEWLTRLVAPLVQGKADVSTAYHHVIPGDNGIATLGHAVTVLFLYLMYMIPFLNQPWGGSTAIRRSLFERLGVAGIWERTVVDDVSLARVLRRSGLEAYPVPAATVRTPTAGQRLGDWSDWLTRQLMYLKFFFPVAWVVGGLLAFVIVGGQAALAAGLVASMAGLAPAATGGVCTLFLLWGFVPPLLVRVFHPSPGGAFQYIAAGYVAMVMTCWCHAQTWFSSKIRWRGVTYQVKHGGEVIKIRR